MSALFALADQIEARFTNNEATNDIAKEIKNSVDTRGITLLKMIDEYNYAKFTKKWI
jgi:hypothetical protein